MQVLKGIGWIFLALIFVSAMATKNPNASASAGAVSAKLVCEATKAKQAARRDLVDRAIATGLIQKVATPGTTPRVYVRKAFLSMDYDFKVNLLGVIYALEHECRAGKWIGIYDASTDKSLGHYSPATGLSL